MRQRRPDESSSVATETRVLEEIDYVEERELGALFVVQGDISLIDADFYLLPTDAGGNVENIWREMWGIDNGMQLTTLEDRSEVKVSSTGFRVVPCDVGGDYTPNTVESVMKRLDDALDILSGGIALTHLGDPDAPAPEFHRTRPARRWRPLLAMPIIGVGRGGLGATRGEVIRHLITAIENFLEMNEDTMGRFDIVLVCRTSADYAAVQHVRRRNIDLEDLPGWLVRLVEYARAGRLAAMFGAGVSAASGLPTWDQLLEELATRFEMPQATADGLTDLDPTDAATLLFQQAMTRYGHAGAAYYQEALRELLGLEQTTLTLSLLANMKLSIAITTNYDHGYEIALKAMGQDEVDVLPWARSVEGDRPLMLKLHGDVERGLIVLSRDEFVAMHAFRRPLAGVLQDQLLSGHVLIVGSSMSDPTLVHASEEVAGLLRHVNSLQVNAVDDGDQLHQGLVSNGTILMGNPHPARETILSRSLTVTTAALHKTASAQTARRIDVVLDLINCLASRDLSFALDESFSDLLSDSEKELAQELRRLHEKHAHSYSPTGVSQALKTLLDRLGYQ